MSDQDKPGSEPVLSGTVNFEANQFEDLCLPGLKMIATCPHCRTRVLNYLDDMSLIKIAFNKPIDFYMYCDEGIDGSEGCGDNFTVKIKMNFSVELA